MPSAGFLRQEAFNRARAMLLSRKAERQKGQRKETDFMVALRLKHVLMNGALDRYVENGSAESLKTYRELLGAQYGAVLMEEFGSLPVNENPK